METMEIDRRRRLESLAGWSWGVRSDLWEEGFSHLKSFSEREGHCRVLFSYKADDDYWLGQWVSIQRKTKYLMELDRRQRLEALAGWSWNAFADKWEVGLSHLKEFSELEDHCRVPLRYITKNGYRLGRWVGIQRENRNKMEPERRQRLEALPGWVWNRNVDR